MDRLQENRIKPNRKRWIIPVISGCVLLIGIVVGLSVYFHHNRDSEQVSELVEQMADLVNEPSSPEDEVYVPAEDSDEEVFYRIRVNKTRNCITVYKKDNKGEYTEPVKAMVCSVGYNAPVGTYKTSDRYTWKIVNGNVWSQYATRITGNVLFHSVTYSEKNKATLIPKYYNQLGMSASAGCIRLMVKDAKWLTEHCVPGTEVEIYEDEDPGPLGKPISIIVANTETWDPSDPDDANPWKGHEASLEGAADRVVERGIGINYLEGLVATDTIGNTITNEVKVETDLNYKKVGAYAVKYTLTDGVGSKVTKEVEYQVVDTRPPYFSGIKKQITAKNGQTLTSDELLAGVYVIDNNEVLSKDRIELAIPEQLMEGTNLVTYSVTDDYGNTATATTEIIVDYEPPVIHLRPEASNVLDSYQVVDEAFARARVYATDSGEELPETSISVIITPLEWGYQFLYTAVDDSGQTATLTDTVTYPYYTIKVDGDLMNSDFSSASLMQGVHLIDQSGNEVEGATLAINIVPNGSQYQVTYSYGYACILGTNTATAVRNVSGPATAAPTVEPSHSPLNPPQTHTPETPEPGPTKSPAETQAPGDMNIDGNAQ